MNWLPLAPLVILPLTAMLIWALDTRTRTAAQGYIALGSLGASLAIVAGSQLLMLPNDLQFMWAMLNGQPIVARFVTGGGTTFFGVILLLGSIVAAGGLTWTLGSTTRAFGLLFAGLLLLTTGGLITIWSAVPLASVLGLGVVWLGGTIMQQATTAHNDRATFGGLTLLIAASLLLIYAATPQLTGGPITPLPWVAGCAVLIGLLPRWGTTPTAPLLVRATVSALGLPIAGAYLLTQYALSAAPTWDEQTTFVVLLIGCAGLVLGSINALVARRLSTAFAWQLVAQLSLIVIVFGTGRAEAGPMATGLLAHTLITGVAIALAVGQLERATRTDEFAILPPLPAPLRRSGLAYGLAALSCAGIPPLLGYGLRRVVLLLANIAHPWWLPALMLGASTLLALSYLPTLIAFFRRPAFRSPVARVEGRGGGWPLLLMIGLLLGGLIPDPVWQWLLGDTATQPTVPSASVIASTAITALLTLIMFGLINRALRHPQPVAQFAGGEPLDEEPGWTLPFTALRETLRPLALPERARWEPLAQWIERVRDRISGPLAALEQQYYLALVVVSLIGVLLLAAQP